LPEAAGAVEVGALVVEPFVVEVGGTVVVGLDVDTEVDGDELALVVVVLALVVVVVTGALVVVVVVVVDAEPGTHW
jgi:hypothetical protein